MKKTVSVAAVAVLIMICLASGSAAAGSVPAGNAAAGGSAVAEGPGLALSDTDYSRMRNWVRFGGAGGERDVDIFVVYPTVSYSDREADNPYIRLSNLLMRIAAAVWLNDMNSVVAAHADVYAPLYRQINVAALPALNAGAYNPLADGPPREDIFAAFAYYLENVNKNERPFILLGQSQGGQMVTELATTFLGDARYAGYNKNHIATYSIGYSVTPDQILKNPRLSFSRRPDDVGVIMSWNTTTPGEVKSGAYKGFGTWREGAEVTNPLTWLTDGAPSEAAQFKKTFSSLLGFIRAEGEAAAVADNARGLLVVTSLDESEYPEVFGGLLSKYHSYDVWFFADSIRQNIADRIDAFYNIE